MYNWVWNIRSRELLGVREKWKYQTGAKVAYFSEKLKFWSKKSFSDTFLVEKVKKEVFSRFSKKSRFSIQNHDLEAKLLVAKIFFLKTLLFVKNLSIDMFTFYIAVFNQKLSFQTYTHFSDFYDFPLQSHSTRNW